MPPAAKTILGTILVVIGVIDLLKFGWQILAGSPMLIIGILFTAGGAALISSGRKSLP
ncbi:MAG: hypothetical protein FJZ01_00450 [Candidatus Sericytochromatia bacterium]|nr:hypothetical protein [Candidatus Tanganyikabacteria bacterium]